MKSYPSIHQATGQKFEGLGVVDVFDKLDGQNMRFEFSKKKGWHKFGPRTQMVDETSEQFGDAVVQFKVELGDAIINCFGRTPQKLVVFCEYWGLNSFCGMHDPDDDMHLTVIDACLENRGFMTPKDFRKTFEDRVHTPAHLGQHNWTRGFVQRVRDGEIDCEFEGVVGKTFHGAQYKMVKAKTQAWLDKVYATYPEKDADKIAAS